MYNSGLNNHISNRSPKLSSRSGDVAHSHHHSDVSHLSNPTSIHGGGISRSLSPVPPRRSRSSNNSPLSLSEAGHMPHSLSTSAFSVTQPYYSSGDDPTSPIPGNSGISSHGHRSRPTLRSHHSIEGPGPHERGFMPIRERERSLDRQQAHHRHGSRGRDRSLDRLTAANQRERDEMYAMDRVVDDDMYPNPEMKHGITRDKFILELQSQINDIQNKYMTLKKELDLTSQKLCSSMHSIKTFWSPELKKERALRKEEAAKYALMSDQLKLLNSENQKQSKLIEQLEEELRLNQIRNPTGEIQHQFDAMLMDREHQSKENYLLRETIKELELRVDTQKQTLGARDESIKKLLEMLQSKGVGGKMMEEDRLEYEKMKTRVIESEARSRHFEGLLDLKDKDLIKVKEELKQQSDKFKDVWKHQAQPGSNNNRINTLSAIIETKESRINTLEKELSLMENAIRQGNQYVPVEQRDESAPTKKVEEMRIEFARRDQEILAMGAKMRTLEEQHTDYQRHISVLKESLCAKEEHYNMLQADVEELRQRLEEKNKLIEKKTQQAVHATQERNRLNSELNELKDHMDIKDRKINVLQRKADIQELTNKVKDTTKASNDAEANEIANARKDLMEKQKSLEDMEKKLKKRKEKLDQIEAKVQKAEIGNNEAMAKQINELQQKCQVLQKENLEKEKFYNKSKDGGSQVQAELDRLLQILTKMEEEKFNLNKQVKDLQDALESRGNVNKPQANERRRNPSGHDEGRRQQEASKQNKPQCEEEHQISGCTCDTAKLISMKEEEIERLKAEIDRYSNEIKVIKQSETSRLEEVNDARAEIEVMNEKINVLQRALKENVALNDKIVQLELDLSKLKKAESSFDDKNREVKKYVDQIRDLKRSLDDSNRACIRLAELEKELELARLKRDDSEMDEELQDRVEELEEALKESVRITADREFLISKYEQIIKSAEEKVNYQQAELRSYQKLQNARCTACPSLRNRLTALEIEHNKLVSERQSHLQEMFAIKHEALSAAMSDKDAHIALLEMSGIKDKKTSDDVDRLRTEKRDLMNMIKAQNEKRVELLADYSPSSSSSVNVVSTERRL